MGRSGIAWSLVSANDVLQLDRISSTWNLKIPSSEPPNLPQGVERDPVRKREDWDEVSDSFGMVRIKVSVGRKEASKREFSDWLKSEAKLPDIAIGDIFQEDHSAIIEIHVEKAGATLEIDINQFRMNGDAWTTGGSVEIFNQFSYSQSAIYQVEKIQIGAEMDAEESSDPFAMAVKEYYIADAINATTVSDLSGITSSTQEGVDANGDLDGSATSIAFGDVLSASASKAEGIGPSQPWPMAQTMDPLELHHSLQPANELV